MELCKFSLRQYANKQRKLQPSGMIPEDDLKRIMRDVCLGLQELHSRGIVHLDIKPENILESFSGKFKLGDLGMARL
jgi:serine/threonine protein kinase